MSYDDVYHQQLLLLVTCGWMPLVCVGGSHLTDTESIQSSFKVQLFNFLLSANLFIYLFITLHLSSLQLQDVGGYYHVGPSLVSWSRFRTLLAIGFRTSFCIACRHVDVEDVEPLGCRHVLLTTGAAEVISLKISTLKLNFQLIISR